MGKEPLYIAPQYPEFNFYVKGKSIVSITPLTKESLKQPLSEFNLGPVLPHMEKSYLFFIKR